MWALGKYVFTIKNVHAFRPSRLNECRPVLDIYGKCKPVMNSLQQWKPNSSVTQICKNIRAVAIGGGGGGGKGGGCPPGPIEPDTSSLWMDLFSLDSVTLIIVTCNCLPFSNSRSTFRRHIPWQVLKIAFRSTPRPPYKARGFGTRDNAPPLQKS